MLIRYHSLRNTIGAAHGGARVFKHASEILLVVDYEVVRRHTELCTVVVVTSVACYCGNKFDFLSVSWRNEMHGRVLAVVVLIKRSSSEERHKFKRN